MTVLEIAVRPADCSTHKDHGRQNFCHRSSFSKDMEGVPYVTGKIDIANVHDDVIKMLGVKTNITFGFLIPIFSIHYATFGKLS